jgi:putative toxin-antitoxin system antitoxin component (TIGR02293 family)
LLLDAKAPVNGGIVLQVPIACRAQKSVPPPLILPIWASILFQLGRKSRMLPNYDAKAIAEVMGIEFRWPEQGSVKALSNWVSAPSAFLIAKAVESGLPRKVLRRVAERIAGEDKAKVSALEFDVVPKTTLQRREGRKLTLHESEQTEHVARLFVHARRALGTEAEAREFMTAAHPELDGRTPVDAAKTDLGTLRAEQILNALEYGLAL